MRIPVETLAPARTPIVDGVDLKAVGHRATREPHAPLGPTVQRAMWGFMVLQAARGRISNSFKLSGKGIVRCSRGPFRPFNDKLFLSYQLLIHFIK